MAAEAVWVEASGYKKPKPRGWFVASEKQTRGLMIRMDEDQYALFRKYLSMTRYSRKLFLQRLISGVPLDLNLRERLEAYGGFGPCNRIDNNIRQIVRHPDAVKMNSGELEQLSFLSIKLQGYAVALVEFSPGGITGDNLNLQKKNCYDKIGDRKLFIACGDVSYDHFS